MELCRPVGVKAAQAFEHSLAAELVILPVELASEGVAALIVGKVTAGDERIDV